MRIHLYDETANDDVAWKAETAEAQPDQRSWATCGKRIKNANITDQEAKTTCATCLKVWDKSKISEDAA